ncbi:hypothetical protein PIB30_072714 [Stylosanthes scabra]|uniref:Uncharacterized protein n=1 Tax=Stylosanthes scabra TaxID=79078 RepID=A0ABU6QNQ8_9FABA|nr:hypothetical protein [Stylosanthes scabra]
MKVQFRSKKDFIATQSKCKEGQPSPKRMKKAVPKKLDFTHLQSTFDAISRRVKDDVNKNQGPQVEPTATAMPNSDSIDTGDQRRQNHDQVAQEMIQERVEDFPLPSSDSLLEAEGNLMDQDGPEIEKGRPIVRATTIDEFLKENGTDVDLNGLITGKESNEEDWDRDDSLVLNQNHYKYVMADIDEDEGKSQTLI